MADSPLGAAQLNASANVPGTFEYTPPAGTVFPIGLHSLSATFTPNDLVNYSPTGVTRTLTVFTGSASSTLALEQVTGESDRWVDYREWVFDPALSLMYMREGDQWDSLYNKIKVINTVNGQVIRVIDLPSVSESFHLAADFGRRRLYVADVSHGRLIILNIDTGSVIESVPAPALHMMGNISAMNPASGELFLIGSGTVTVFDPTRSSADPMRFRQFPLGLAYYADAEYQPIVNPDTNLLYMTHYCCANFERTTSVFDVNPSSPNYGSMLASIADVEGPYVFDRQRKLVYAAKSHHLRWEGFGGEPASVMVIDADPASSTAHTVIARVDVPTPPLAVGVDPLFVVSLAMNPARDLLYVLLGQGTNATDSDGPVTAVASIDMDAREVRSILPLDYGPAQGSFQGRFISVDPLQNRIFALGRRTAIFTDAQPNEIVVAASATAEPVSVGPLTLDFDQVTSTGVVSVELIDPAAANLTLPGQFAIDGGIGFDITSTASLSGQTVVCLNMSGVTDPDAFAALRILHGENGSWVDRTASSNFETGRVCASVSSFSPFVVARLDATYQTAVLFDTTRSFKSGSTIPIKVRLLNGAGGNVSSPLVAVNAKQLRRDSTSTTAALQDAGNANGDRNFRYDSAVGGYIYNLSTKGLKAGTHTLVFTAAGDTQHHGLQFQVR
jgi:hypothetical protein